MYAMKYAMYIGRPTFSIRGYAMVHPFSDASSAKVGRTEYKGMAMLETCGENISPILVQYIGVAMMETCGENISPIRPHATIRYCGTTRAHADSRDDDHGLGLRIMQAPTPDVRPYLDLIQDILPARGGPREEQHVAKAEVDVVAPHGTDPKVHGCAEDPASEPCLDGMRHGRSYVVREHPHDQVVLPYILLYEQLQALSLGHGPQGGP